MPRFNRFTLSGLASSLMLVAGAASAAVPEGVTTALTEAKTDSLVVAGLALVVIIAIAGFKYMRRAV